MQNSLEHVSKTIFLYDVCEKESDLHSDKLDIFAHLLINPKIPIRIEQKTVRKKIFYEHSSIEEDATIKKKSVNIFNSSEKG